MEVVGRGGGRVRKQGDEVVGVREEKNPPKTTTASYGGYL